MLFSVEEKRDKRLLESFVRKYGEKEVKKIVESFNQDSNKEKEDIEIILED